MTDSATWRNILKGATCFVIKEEVQKVWGKLDVELYLCSLGFKHNYSFSSSNDNFSPPFPKEHLEIEIIEARKGYVRGK